eukprot:3389820-Pyramimonas_sp.AAC.1
MEGMGTPEDYTRMHKFLEFVSFVEHMALEERFGKLPLHVVTDALHATIPQVRTFTPLHTPSHPFTPLHTSSRPFTPRVWPRLNSTQLDPLF